MLPRYQIVLAGLLGCGLAGAVLFPAARAVVNAINMPRASTLQPQPKAPPAAAAARPRAPVAPAAPPTNPREGTARLSGIHVVRELAVPRWLHAGEFVWNDEEAPKTGETVIVVNIRARVLSVFRAGHEIGRSSLIYGADEKPTPHGVFPILQKDRDHVSNLYDAPMPHMLRLTNDGVAIHGSPELSDDYATHGCIGLPREFAALLFDVMKVGDRVVVWDGERHRAL